MDYRNSTSPSIPRVDRRQPIVITNFELLTPSQLRFKKKPLTTANLYLSSAALSRPGAVLTKQRKDGSLCGDNSLHKSTDSSSYRSYGSNSYAGCQGVHETLQVKREEVKRRKRVTFAEILSSDFTPVRRGNTWTGGFHNGSQNDTEKNDFLSKSDKRVLNKHTANVNTLCATTQGDVYSTVTFGVDSNGVTSYSQQDKQINSLELGNQTTPDIDLVSVTSTCTEMSSHQGDPDVLENSDPPAHIPGPGVEHDARDLEDVDSIHAPDDIGSVTWYDLEKSEYEKLFQKYQPKHADKTENHVSSAAPPLTLHKYTTNYNDAPKSDNERRVIKVTFLKDGIDVYTDTSSSDHSSDTYASQRFQKDLQSFPSNESDNGINPRQAKSVRFSGYPIPPHNSTNNLMNSLPKQTDNSGNWFKKTDSHGSLLKDTTPSSAEIHSNYLMQIYEPNGEKKSAAPESSSLFLTEQKFHVMTSHPDPPRESLHRETSNTPRSRETERRQLSAYPLGSQKKARRLQRASSADGINGGKEVRLLDKINAAERYIVDLEKKMAERTRLNRQLESLVLSSTRFGKIRFPQGRSRTNLN